MFEESFRQLNSQTMKRSFFYVLVKFNKINQRHRLISKNPNNLYFGHAGWFFFLQEKSLQNNF